MQQFLKVLQIINVVLTLCFLVAYVYRLCHLRHFAVTYRYTSKYPYTRIVLCLCYAVLSVPFLAISIVYDRQESNVEPFWMVEFGVGECIDALILTLQLWVLRQELNKERPYTPIHLLFCIYLTLISIVRLVCVLIYIKTQQSAVFLFMGFYLVFLINAVFLLSYWVAKRQELPQFEKYKYFNFDEFQTFNNNTHIINRNIEISYLKKSSDSFNYIRPTVSVEKGKFRIVLEIYDTRSLDRDEKDKAERSALSENDRPTQKIRPEPPKLKVISSNLYTMQQVLQLYKICGRFNIYQKLNFDTHNLAEVYKSLQTYLEELFQNRKNYLRFMLKFFEVEEDYVEGCERALRETFKDSEMDIFANMDKNAALISIRIYKQLWIDDYYLFYIDVVAVDGKFESRPMKRYNDFEMFHTQLSSIIKRRYGGKYELPALPKKYLLNGDEGKVTQRRNELQHYLRSLANDYKLMLELHEIREATLEFLGLYEQVSLEPSNEAFKAFYKNIEIFKGSISKQLTNNQYVTFYEFKILYNGIPVRSFKKRYNEFSQLHEAIVRWMHNQEISYKFIVLPEKHLYKSGKDRHDKLRAYLESLLKITDLWKIYEVNAFLFVGNNTMKDLSVSGIKSPEEEYWSTKKNTGLADEDELQTQRFIDEESFESKGRMSALIEQLGSN